MARTYGKAQDLIDFTRASSGTALRRVKYGAELVSNGTFDSDITGWSDLVGTSTYSSGTLQFTSSAGGQGAYQAFPTVAGKVYRAEASSTSASISHLMRVHNTDSPSGGVVLESAVAQTSQSTFVVVFVAESSTSNIYLRNGEAGVVNWDNVSVKEVTFDTSDGDLVLFNHPNNIPRIEYDANGNLLGLLVEESRVNLLTYSEDFDNAYWSKTDVTLSIASVKAPDGSYTATKVTASGVSPHMVKQSVASSGDCKSIWARSVSGTGTVSLLANSGSSDNIVTLTEDWQRFDILYDDEINPVPSFFYAVDFRGASTLTEAIIWGAQLEAGSFPTSYIPTSGSTATRSADVASITTSNFGYNKSEGAMYVEVSGINVSNSYVNLFGTGGSSTQSIFASQSGGFTKIWAGDNPFASIDGLAQNITLKIASSFTADGINVSVNGSSIASAGAQDTIDDVVNFKIGGPWSTQNGVVHIKSAKYIPRSLTNAQLQELTS